MTNQMNMQKPCFSGTAAVTTSTTASGAAPCAGSAPTSLERTRFFPRQLVTPDDLTQDQIYFRDKLRRHNRMLHGWGVVCGTRCQWTAGDCNVIIEAGYILGPYGDEIVISSQQIVNLCKQNMDGNTFSGCGDLTDPWCKDVRATRQPGQTYYLAVRYDECQGRPVSVPSGDCGCSDGGCEYTRIRDSYVIQVLDTLPDSYADFTPPDLLGVTRCDPKNRGRACSDCPSDPWVILADFTLNADGTLAGMDCFAHRRYVVSFADYWFSCRSGLQYGSNEIMQPARSSMGLLDMKMMNTSMAPAQATAVRLPDGAWTTLPVYFSVKPGETVADLLQAEGDRQYLDSSTGDSYTLREIYALSGASPDTVLNSIQDAVRPLDGLTLDVPGLRVVQGSIANAVSSAGMANLNTLALGDPSSAPALNADTLQGVDAASKVAKAIAGQTIAEVAAVPQAEFIKKATTGVAAKQAAEAEAQARLVWNNASRVVNLAKAWKKS